MKLQLCRTNILIIGVLVLCVSWTHDVFAIVGPAIVNPVGVSSISDLLVGITKWLLGLSAIITVLAIVFGGVRLIGSLGNEQEVAKAKQIIMWAVIGLIVVMTSYAILSTVGSVIGL